VTSAGYIDATVRMLRAWGVSVSDETTAAGARHVRVAPGAVSARDFEVEIDASSATYWLTAGAIVPGAVIDVVGAARVRATQPDGGYGAALASFGAAVDARGDDLRVAGPARLVSPGTIDMEAMPDAAMSIAMVAACCDEPTRIEGLATLRVKESDRIAALAAELDRVGARVTAEPAALVVQAPVRRAAAPVRVHTYHDHRIAMAFGILGLVRPGLAIDDPGCVAKSYPGFWDDLHALLRGRVG
jgi:3-phosphoshikimate 1-carboxyvinyltransferase